MLETGRQFPDFSLPNQDGKTVTLGDFSGRWLVVYFYPKDDTPGCTIQGKSFTASKEDFEAAGISVVGVSQDDVASHKDFCNKFGFTIDLLADTSAELLKACGVGQSEYKGTMYWDRTSIVADPKGIVRKVYEKVNPQGHEQTLLADIKNLQNESLGEKQKASTVKPIPDGYHSITPHLIIKGAAQAIEFYKKAFGATEVFRMEHEGQVGHAEIKIGDSPIMLADEFPGMGFVSPATLGGTPVSLMIYVDDVDETFKAAIAEGGKELKPLQDQFYGDRSGTLTDPFGHIWTVATHKEDITPEEMDKRAAAARGGA
jgi:thioredoxin-dependent peroxiredoxin